MIIFVPEDEADWLEWRKKGVGASDVSALFQRNPFLTKQQLWENIVKGRKQDVNYHMVLGHEKEAVAVDWLTDALPKWGSAKIQVCAVHDTNPLIRCTLDVYNAEENAIAEIKFLKNVTRLEEYRKNIPFHHHMQIQQQLMVSGAKYCYYLTIGADDNCSMQTIFPNKEDMARIEREIGLFWADHVATGIPPQPEPKSLNSPEVRKKIKRLIRLRRYVEEYNAIKDDLKPVIDTHKEFVCAGVKCYCTKGQSRVRYRDLIELPCVQMALKNSNINMEDYRNENCLSYKFVPVRDDIGHL